MVGGSQGQAKAWFQGLFWLIGVHLKNLSKRPNTYTIPSPSSFPAGAYYHILRSAAVVSAHISDVFYFQVKVKKKKIENCPGK
ncbi:unnamed protein product [Natator depressus]